MRKCGRTGVQVRVRSWCEHWRQLNTQNKLFGMTCAHVENVHDDFRLAAGAAFFRCEKLGVFLSLCVYVCALEMYSHPQIIACSRMRQQQISLIAFAVVCCAVFCLFHVWIIAQCFGFFFGEADGSYKMVMVKSLAVGCSCACSIKS